MSLDINISRIRELATNGERKIVNIPMPDKVGGELICTADQLEEGESMEFNFKRVDYTNTEIAALPKC